MVDMITTILTCLTIITTSLFGILTAVLYVVHKDPSLPRFRIIEITLKSGAKRYKVMEKSRVGYFVKTETYIKMWEWFSTTEEIEFDSLQAAQRFIDRILLKESIENGNKEESRRIL